MPPSNQTEREAEALNQKGNSFYIANQLSRAEECYKKAERLDSKEPKYPSNHSAVLYEQGNYLPCIESIIQAWNRLRSQHIVNGKPSTPPGSDGLGIKLATRLAKAKLNALASRLISVHPDSPLSPNNQQHKLASIYEIDIERFASIERKPGDKKVEEMRAAWDQWNDVRGRCAKHGAEQCEVQYDGARRRLRRLRILKAPTDPTLEFFKFGHDEVRSLAYGFSHAKGYKDEYFGRLLDGGETDIRTPWTFLFGGSGDARHVYATIVDLGFLFIKAFKPMEMIPDMFNSHMTLLDIHPAIIARTVIMFALLRRVIQLPGAKHNAQRVELYATLFYLQTTIIMPDYCHQILVETIKAVLSELNIESGQRSLTRGIYINEGTVPLVLDTLNYWLTLSRKSTETLLERNANSFRPPSQLIPLQGAAVIDRKRCGELHQELTDSVRAQKAEHGADSFRRPFDAEDLATEFLYPYYSAHVEAEIFHRIKILLPPQSLLAKRHPAIYRLVKVYTDNSTPQDAWNSALKEVLDTWKPNPFVFDKDTLSNPRYGGAEGYPRVLSDPYHSILSFGWFGNVRLRSKEYKTVDITRSTGFDMLSRFFELTVEGMNYLAESLKLELVVGDAITGVARLMAGELGPRPASAPTRYKGIWLSNIPDYTHGPLNTAVHSVQHSELDSMVLSNCLVNMGIFKSIDEFCYNYTLLRANDFPRFLGCTVLPGDFPTTNDMALKPLYLPLPVEKLASKEELHRWLSHLFLCTVSNGLRAPNEPRWTSLPNNLNAFFHVLMHLYSVGFPSHWMGDFIQMVISDTLVCGVVPYDGYIPVPLTEINNRRPPRKVNLSAWQLDLEVILASIGPALPFSVSLPENYPPLDNIWTYSATTSLLMDPDLMRSVTLLFYKPSKDYSPQEVLTGLKRVIDGVGGLASAQVQILLCQDKFEPQHGRVYISWKMNRSWFTKMRKESWKMVAFRTDVRAFVTNPSAAGEWVELL